MSSPPTVFPLIIVPSSVYEYNWNVNQDRKDRIILCCAVLRHFQHIKDNKELMSIVAKFVGSRYRQYLDAIISSGINPLSDEEYESCVSYHITSPEVIPYANKLIEYL